MKMFVVKKTTTLVSSNKILGEPNSIAKIFEDEEFAMNYYKKYLTEPKIYSASKKVFWTYTEPEAMDLTLEQIDELQTKDPYIQFYKKDNQ